ncbi:MAG: hypothetical protein QUV08_12450 [Parasphingorhabdus sp.]|nr:hypothetical protein [Parasphingorhabdus sp.]
MKNIAFAFATFALVSACGDLPDETSSEPAGPPMEVSSVDLAKAYEENEVAAKGVYDGNTLIVSGKIQSIELDMFDEPVVSLPGANEYSNVQASFSDEYSKKTAELKKGQDITVSCTSITEAMGTPMLSNCSF